MCANIKTKQHANKRMHFFFDLTLNSISVHPIIIYNLSRFSFTFSLSVLDEKLARVSRNIHESRKKIHKSL